MKKNVIRLTESELKNYIRKVISEQTAPAAQPPVKKSNPVDLVKTELVGKNVQLFLDAGKSQKYTVVRINSSSLLTDNSGAIRLGVTDLTYVDDNLQNIALNATAKKVWALDFTCGKRDSLVCHLEDWRLSQSKITVFGPQLQEKLTTIMGCPAKTDRTVHLSSASQKPVDLA
jgi:hypothetical protein